MAIYHLSVKVISRSSGRSATGAAAYRAAEKVIDERTGLTHDFTRKSGVESAELVLPADAPAWAQDRAALWNAAEKSEKRKDACVAREYEVALPHELTPAQRKELAHDFAREMAKAEGCAVDVCIHAPGRGGDNRNHHAHIMRTTRVLTPEGFGPKVATEQSGRNRREDLEQVRKRWAELCNEHLQRAGHSVRVDHRSLDAQGIDREPTRHLGPGASGYERRTGQASRVRLSWDEEAGITNRLRAAGEAGRSERQAQRADRSIIDLSGDLAGAKRERESYREAAGELRAGADAVRRQMREEQQKEIARRVAMERARMQAELAKRAAEEAAKVAKKGLVRKIAFRGL